jgi:hypothetical protein
MQNKALNFVKEKASNVSLVFFKWMQSFFLRGRELWPTFRLSPTNSCLVGRRQDNALWVCHVCIRASAASPSLSLSLSLSLLYLSYIYIYIYISYMHRNIYKRDVLVCLFYSRNRFPNITILWRLIKKGPQRDFRLSIILSFYFFLDELFYLFCTLVFHPFHQPIYSPSLKIRLSTARGKQVVYKQLAWFLL